MPSREPEDLRALGARLDAARGEKPTGRGEPNLSGMAIGFRLLTELVAAAVVGLGLGWLLDWAFGTHLVFLLIMFALGVVAGIRNAIRAGNELNRKLSSNGNEK